MLRMSHVTTDCHDAYALSAWWKSVLGYTDVPGDPNEPGDEECMIVDPDTGARLLFIEVPEDKAVKNRVHFDLSTRDRTRDEEIERVLGLGATEVADRRRPDGAGWMTLADPEGNEFCIVRSAAERARASGDAEASSPTAPGAGTFRPVGFWVKLVDQLLEERLDATLATHSLTRRGWQVLNSLGDGGLSQAELGARLEGWVSDGGDEIGATVASLIETDQVQASEGALVLTGAGVRTRDAATDDVGAFRRLVAEGIDRSDYGTALAVLEGMATNLGWSD